MVSLPNVQFYTDSDILLPSSARELQQLAEYLSKNEAVNATIIGHTDNTGDPQRNLDLSKRRAESVKRFLQSLGVAGDRLQAIGMGDKRPKADNNNKEGRLMNRRVEVQLVTKESTETKRTQVPREEGKTAP
jgi:outer membrane protein OmpA-like peptidoglycan-associated protein